MSTLTYAQARKWEPEAARRGVSAVARSSRGFMRALQRVGTVAKLPEAWKRKRAAFIARHMAQGRSERLWKNGRPSRRALALIMWAYMPPGRGGARRNPIPVEVAEALPYRADIPQSAEFVAAVDNTRGAKLTPSGLVINLQRCQQPEQHLSPALRGAVFYLPEGDKNISFYKRKGTLYGGDDCITGTTLLKRPLVVKGATGGKVPEAALKVLTGDKKAPDNLDARINQIVRISGMQSRRDLIPLVEEALTELGGTPHLAYEMVENSARGNTLRYALRENVICTKARDAGYDSIVGWSHGAKRGYFISEVIDLREDAYPSPFGNYSIHGKFEKPLMTNPKPPRISATALATMLITEEGRASARKLTAKDLQHAIDTVGARCRPADVRRAISSLIAAKSTAKRTAKRRRTNPPTGERTYTVTVYLRKVYEMGADILGDLDSRYHPEIEKVTQEVDKKVPASVPEWSFLRVEVVSAKQDIYDLAGNITYNLRATVMLEA